MSVWWYRDIVGFALGMPAWTRPVAAIGTDAVLFVFAAGMLWSWWRARRGNPRALALALLGPAGAAVAYLVSEAVKSVVREQRPCAALTQARIVACPPPGDWSFPSNHSVAAGAAGFAAVLACRSAAFWAIPAALLAALSRVVVGVHYPHDVAAGLALGGTVALLVILPLQRPGARLIGHQRSLGRWRWLVGPTRHEPEPQTVPGHRVASFRNRNTNGRVSDGRLTQPPAPLRQHERVRGLALMGITRTAEVLPAPDQLGARSTGTLSTASRERRTRDPR
ncbi:phosphatase PAP2 family protein [Prauserella flavalba]|uniref:Phosphatidic acid phosphatase type 2/haloperoxidase domain-containing protein n=1 Tax=Prauserella flavalba TaxID=1477506 RepID=A0A318LFV3_9PSEU|nr:phosphatase PAP2 family protein [Prauserella flavalba]PXY17043.1 hypothetical protein BA062_37860 [Prauserella flavalba]